MRDTFNPWDPDQWSVRESERQDTSLPLITIGILNYNRCEDLRRTLDVVVRAIQYPLYEVIVVDNGSTDGSVEMVHLEYPSVRVHEVGWNKGTSSRNFQSELAKGKYLFSLDDDTFPATPASILHTVKYLEAHSEVDVLSMTYYQPISGLDETGEDALYRIRGNAREGYEGVFLAEGGVCFRLSSLRTVDGYDPRIICYREGYDLALQLYKKGFKIRYCPWFATLHFKSPAMRSSGRLEYFIARHVTWILAKHWPAPFATLLVILWTLRRIIGIIMHPFTALSSTKGLLHGIREVPAFLRYKPKLNARQAIGLGRFYLQLFRW